MDCPRCSRPLALVLEGLHEDIETHVCGACGGGFYPRGSLDRLDDNVAVNVETLSLRPRPGEPALRCPLGHARHGGTYRSVGARSLRISDSVQYGHVSVAVCDECGGFWLERGVLDQLREVALRMSADENRDLNERAAELKRLRDKKATTVGD